MCALLAFVAGAVSPMLALAHGIAHRHAAADGLHASAPGVAPSAELTAPDHDADHAALHPAGRAELPTRALLAVPQPAATPAPARAEHRSGRPADVTGTAVPSNDSVTPGQPRAPPHA